MNTRHPSIPCPKMMTVWLKNLATIIPYNNTIPYNTTIPHNPTIPHLIVSLLYYFDIMFASFWHNFYIILYHISAFAEGSWTPYPPPPLAKILNNPIWDSDQGGPKKGNMKIYRNIIFEKIWYKIYVHEMIFEGILVL